METPGVDRAGDVADRKVPGNVRLTPESGGNQPVQIGKQWDRGCIFVGFRLVLRVVDSAANL